MAKAMKELDKARNSPSGWHFDSLRSLYEKFDFIVESAKGSHFTVWHPLITTQTTIINHSRELPKAYVIQAVAMIDELLALKGEGDDSK